MSPPARDGCLDRRVGPSIVKRTFTRSTRRGIRNVRAGFRGRGNRFKMCRKFWGEYQAISSRLDAVRGIAYPARLRPPERKLGPMAGHLASIPVPLAPSAFQ